MRRRHALLSRLPELLRQGLVFVDDDANVAFGLAEAGRAMAASKQLRARHARSTVEE
jgi:hypothetical protein